MSGWEEKLMEAFVREVRKQAEADYMRCLRNARLELQMLLAESTCGQCEGEEWARLEEVD